MQELNYDLSSNILKQQDEVISFKCELQENLQKAMKEFVEEHPNGINTGYYKRLLQDFCCKKDFKIEI